MGVPRLLEIACQMYVSNCIVLHGIVVYCMALSASTQEHFVTCVCQGEQAVVAALSNICKTEGEVLVDF